MSWGRIDDGFTTHRKILALKSKQRKWTWLEILAYTWKHDSPLIPDEISHVIRDAKNAFLIDCERIGLIDRDQIGRRRVNDWELYSNTTVEEKVAAYLSKRPNSSANEVAREVGGKRDLVLAEVAKYKEHSQNGGTPEPHWPVPEVVPEPVPEYHQSGTQSGTHARAPRPSQPNPSPSSGSSNVIAKERRTSSDPNYEDADIEIDWGHTNGRDVERDDDGLPYIITNIERL